MDTTLAEKVQIRPEYLNAPTAIVGVDALVVRKPEIGSRSGL